MIFSLIVVMIITITSTSPAYADIETATVDKASFTLEDRFTIMGTVDDDNRVTLLASMKGPDLEKLTRTTMSATDGTYSFVPVNAEDLFKSEGIYEIKVFTEYQKVEDATVVKIEYENGIATLMPDFELVLEEIGNKQVEETKRLTFTASVTDSSTKDVEYSLEKQPSGATINKNTGLFSWTPTDTQSGGHTFDVVVKAGPLEDREKITVTVIDKPTSTTSTSSSPTTTTPEPEPKVEPEPQPKDEPKKQEENLGLAPFVDETRDPQSYVERYNTEASYKEWFDENYPEYDSIYQAVGLEKPLEIPAPFVDETKDPQSYVERYNAEASYKEWFDENYPEYDSIYQAVGLETPKELAPFVDPNLDPQYYIDRYNNEVAYKEWFDKTYPDITIYQAVGLDEPEFGECGKGTKFVDGMCVIDDSDKEERAGGGCLIATAAYGSEMAPQVQLLREIRDNQLMNTDSGVSFMTGFNQIYYLFSPTIADMEREHPAFKEMVKIGITPMLSSLSIMKYAESDSEVLGYGIGVILMNLGMYVAAPAVLVSYGIKKIKEKRRRAKF